MKTDAQGALKDLKQGRATTVGAEETPATRSQRCGRPDAQQRTGDVIISSATAWGARRQRTAGSAAHGDTDSTITREKKREAGGAVKMGRSSGGS